MTGTTNEYTWSSLFPHQMDSAIRLCYSPLPAAPPRLSSGAIGAAAPSACRVHLSLSHGSFCLSHCSKRHQIAHLLHVNCMLDRFPEGSKNEENGKKIVRGMTGASLVLACVLGAFSLSSKMNPKSNLAYAAWPWNQGSSTAAAPAETRKVPQFQKVPSENEIEALKLYAMAVSKFWDRSEAVRTLQNEYEWWKKESESEHFLEMALIELLLMQGKYKEASERLDNRIKHLLPLSDLPKSQDTSNLTDKDLQSMLRNEPGILSKREIFLYKAIVDTKLNKKDAATWWEAFKSEILTPSPQDSKNVMAQKLRSALI